MKKYPIKRKHLAVGIFLLLVGVTIAPGITAEITPSVLEKSGNTLFSPKNCTVTCHYVTFRGVEQVEKELPISDAVYLSQLMNSSEGTTLASELNRYGLVPRTMKVDQVSELLSETYGQKQLQQTQKLFPAYPL